MKSISLKLFLLFFLLLCEIRKGRSGKTATKAGLTGITQVREDEAHTLNGGVNRMSASNAIDSDFIAHLILISVLSIVWAKCRNLTSGSKIRI